MRIHKGNSQPRFSALAGTVPSLLFTVLLTSCDSAPQSPTTPTPVTPCQVSVTLPQTSVPSAGGTGTVSVSASASQCSWTASSDVPWIGGFSQSSGVGSGDVRFSVAANTNDGARQGDIIVNGTHLRLTQTGASCDVQLSPASQSAPATGMSGTIAVTTGSSCSWSAVSNVGWLVVMSDPSTTGEGMVQFTAADNPGTARTGLIAIGNQLFTVTQAAK